MQAYPCCTIHGKASRYPKQLEHVRLLSLSKWNFDKLYVFSHDVGSRATAELFSIFLQSVGMLGQQPFLGIRLR